MASDEIGVSHALSILDQYSFRSMDRAVQQFKDMAGELYETLTDIRRFGQRSCLNPVVAPSIKSSAVSGSHQGKKKLEDVGPFLHVVDEDIENPRGRAYALRPRTAQKACSTMDLQSMRKSHSKKAINLQGEVTGAIKIPHDMHPQMLSVTNLNDLQRESIKVAEIPLMMNFSHSVKKEFRQAQGDATGLHPNVVDKGIENSTGRVLRSRTAKKPCNSMSLQKSRRFQAEKCIEPEAMELQKEVIGSTEQLHMMHFQMAMESNVTEPQEEPIRAVQIPPMTDSPQTVKEELKEAPVDASQTFLHLIDKDIEHPRVKAHESRSRTAKKPCISKPVQRVTRSHVEKAIKIEPIEPEGDCSRAMESPDMTHSESAVGSNFKQSQVESVRSIETSHTMGFPHYVKKEFKEVQGETIEGSKTCSSMPIMTDINGLQREIMSTRETHHMIAQKKSLVTEVSQKEENSAKTMPSIIHSDVVMKRVFKELPGEAIGARVTTPHKILSEKGSSVEAELQQKTIENEVNAHIMHSPMTSFVVEEVVGAGFQGEVISIKSSSSTMFSQNAPLTADEPSGNISEEEITLSNEGPVAILAQDTIKTGNEEFPGETEKVFMMPEGSYPCIEASRVKKTPHMTHFLGAIRPDLKELKIGASENKEITAHLKHSQVNSMVAEASKEEVTEVRENPLVLKKQLEQLLTETSLERKASHITHSENMFLVAKGVIENEDLRHIKNQNEIQGSEDSLAEIPQTMDLSSQNECLEMSAFKRGYFTDVMKDVLGAEQMTDVPRTTNSVLHLIDNEHTLSEKDACESSCEKNHTGSIHVNQLVLNNSLQNPGDNSSTLKLSKENQISCSLSENRVSAVTFSDLIQDFPSPVKVAYDGIIKTDFNDVEEKMVESCQPPFPSGTKKSSTNIQEEACDTLLHLDSPQPSAIIARETASHSLTRKPSAQTSNQVNRTPSLLGKRQFPFKSLACGSSRKNHKIRHANHSVDRSTIKDECVNTPTSRKCMKSIQGSSHSSLMYDLSQHDTERTCVPASDISTKDASPNPAYISSTPELNNVRAPSPDLQSRSLVNKDSYQDSTIKSSTWKLNHTKRTPLMLLHKEKTPACASAMHIGPASNHKSRSALSRIKKAIRGIKNRGNIPHLKSPCTSSLIAEVSRSKFIEVKKNPLALEPRVRELQTDTIVLDSQEVSLLAQDAVDMEMSSESESLKESTLKKGCRKRVVNDVLGAEDRKDACQEVNFRSSRMNHAGHDISPMVPNDSSQKSGNKFSTQALKREIQTSYDGLAMRSNNGIRNIMSTMTMGCTETTETDLNGLEDKTTENFQHQSSLGMKESLLHESRQSAFKDLVAPIKFVNTSRESGAEELKDVHKSTKTKRTCRLSDSTEETGFVSFSNKNNTDAFQCEYPPSKTSSPIPAYTPSNVELDGTRKLPSGKEQLPACRGVPFSKSECSHDSCLRSPFTAACLEETDTFLQTYLEDLGEENIDIRESLEETHYQQGIEVAVEYEASRMEENVVISVIPEENHCTEHPDYPVEVASERCILRESMGPVTTEIRLSAECMDSFVLRQNNQCSKIIDTSCRFEEVDDSHDMNISSRMEDVCRVRDSNEAEDVHNLSYLREAEDNQNLKDSAEPRKREVTDKLTDFRDVEEIHKLEYSSETENALPYSFMQEGPDKNSFQFSPITLKDLCHNSAIKHSSQRLKDTNTALDLVSQIEKNHTSESVPVILSPSYHNHRVDSLKGSAEMEAFRFDNDERSLSPQSSGRSLRPNPKEEAASPESTAGSVEQYFEKSTPLDAGAIKFNMLLAQGTVNSSRRKRARSPSNSALASFKKMKLSVNGDEEQDCLKSLSEIYMPYKLPVPRPSFEEVDNPYCVRSPSFSPLRVLLQGKALCFDSQQKQAKGKDKLYQSHSGDSGLGREYLDTPNFRRARSDFDYSCGMPRTQWSDLHTHVEEDEKEAETSDHSWAMAKICDEQNSLSEKQDPTDYSSMLKSSHNRYNLASVTSSFLDLQRQKQAQATLPCVNGKRDIRVKALEAAENAKRLEEKREYERKQRRMEGHETNGGVVSESIKEFCMGSKGVTEKVKRAAGVKMKIDQEKARKQEEERRKKEEERRKKELELADRKRKREDADKREREEKRKRVEEMLKLKREQEERQRFELDAKENRRRMLEDKERKRKAQEEEAKRQRRMEKEREAERRRKQEESLKAARFAEKQADRKRKEAVLLQPRAHDDDHQSASFCQRKFSGLSTGSLSMTSSVEWDVQSRHVLVPIINQPAEARRPPSIPRIGAGIYSHACAQTYGGKLSTSFDENASHILAKQSAKESNSMCRLSQSSNSQCSSPIALPKRSETEVLSYEISPYKSSDDEDDDDDDNPKRPVPSWTRKENLVPHIVRQQYIDPDMIFSSERTCNLPEIFGTAGSKNCLNFKQRGTSGDWLSDNLTLKEEIEYKRTMGYINP